MSSFWNSCLIQFEQELPVQQFNTWIRPLRLEGEDNLDGGLRLVAPNGFILKWVKERYLLRIEELSRTYFDAPISIVLTLAERKAPAALPRQESRLTPVGPGVEEPAVPAVPVRNTNPDEKKRRIVSFTFDNLVEGKANDLARAAERQVSHNPGVA